MKMKLMSIKKSIIAVCILMLALEFVSCQHTEQIPQYNYTLIPFAGEDSLYGYMDTNGKVEIEPQFECAYVFSNGLARVRMDGEYGYINEKGEVVIPAIYLDGTSFSDGYAFVQAKEQHFICIDTEGRMIFELADCIAIRPFSENMAPFCSTLGKWGYVNIEGKVIYIPTFETAGTFHEGVAAIQMHGKWGLINDKGDFVLEPQYSAIGFEE